MIEVYWGPIWAMIVYLTRITNDLLIGTEGVSKAMILEKIHRAGNDFFWIGVILWGMLLVRTDPHLNFVKIVGLHRVCWTLIVVASIFIFGLIISHLQKHRMNLEKDSKGNTNPLKLEAPEVSKKIRSIGLTIHIIGFSNLIISLYMMNSVGG